MSHWSYANTHAGRVHHPADKLCIRDASEYEGRLIDNSYLVVAFVREEDEYALPQIEISMAEGLVAGCPPKEQHHVCVGLQDFIGAIRELARKNDAAWKRAHKEQA